MNRIDRISAILIHLQTKKFVTAGEIASRFSISKRTIYRDLKTLEEAGVPLGAEPGKGYFLVEGYHLPPVMFTSGEANALLLAGKMMEKFSDRSATFQFESALFKIKSVLPEKEKQSLNNLYHSVEVLHSPVSDTAPGYLSDVQLALAQHRTITIDYRSLSRGENTRERIVEPVGICFYGMHWHLVAFCRMRAEYRDFRLDRIQSLRINMETFTPQSRLTLQEYFRNLSHEAALSEVVLRFDEATSLFIQNFKYYYGFVSEEFVDGKMEMYFLVSDLHYFGRWLMMLSDGVEVIRPETLKTLLHDLMKKGIRKQLIPL